MKRLLFMESQNEMVESAPSWPVVWESVSKIIFGYTLLTYNASFDGDMIRSSSAANAIDVPKRIPAECIMES